MLTVPPLVSTGSVSMRLPVERARKRLLLITCWVRVPVLALKALVPPLTDALKRPSVGAAPAAPATVTVPAVPSPLLP